MILKDSTEKPITCTHCTLAARYSQMTASVSTSSDRCGFSIRRAIVGSIASQRPQAPSRILPSFWSVGLDASEASRDSAFCSRVVAEPGSEIFVVCDAAEDERFKYSDLVLGEPFIRFYAGAPLIVPADNGKEYKIGSLCVIDRKPRELERYYYPVMQSLAQLVVAEVDRLRQNVSSFKSSDCTHMKVFVHIFVISSFRKPIRFVAVGHPSMATAGDARHPARPMRARRGADAVRGRGYLAGHSPPARCLPRSLPPPQRHVRCAATAAAAHMR